MGDWLLDIIVIDEMVNGICGKEICFKIKLNISMVYIFVIFLISNNDNGSYFVYVDCGVDKLELCVINICRFKMDI